jgi:RNA polymerase sigma factor (TIGR02999 family)
MERVPNDLAELVQRADRSDPEAVNQLFALLYQELHQLAERHLQHNASALTLGATTLVHEAYLSIASRKNVVFPDQARFFAYASRAMRGLVIDYARRRRSRKRGGGYEITAITDGPPPAGMDAGAELEALGDALGELGELDPALAELVDLHFFGGFSFVEIAELRNVSERTVQRDWQKARLLLHHSLKSPSP